MEEPSPSLPTDLEAWLLVSQTSGIGSRYFQRLIDHFGRPEKILQASRTELSDLGIPQRAISQLQRRQPSDIEPTLTWLREPGHQLITQADDDYPLLLKEIDAPPPLLYLIGDATLLSQPQIAIVGSRNPTPTGINNAKKFAHSLATAGLCVTSGMAIGIDGAAHMGALKAGRTVAAMGTGLDRIYPASHHDLAHRIADMGLLVSEFPPGTPAKAENFPRRNRIISGLCLGTLVIEAAVQSGSLITARLASEQGREVFAIPGSIHNPQARGCHALIRQGAKLVESAQDIVEELGALLGTLAPLSEHYQSEKKSPSDQTDDPEYTRLTEALGYDPVSVDELIARTCLTAEAVSSMLLVLELEGHVSSAPGGLYCRTDTLASRSSGRESK
ncbi:MAG: DNA-processing protein DprA [Candidatus Thiodiazotropha sp. (ex Gloverina cf. vestifex)]|nr:DNA-processing protein DprA [Candidatus Thiodiazotropha sp. (ex Gloverina cf. vestifex)]